MIGASFEHVLDGMDPTSLTLQAEADICAAELHDLASELIFVLRQDPDRRASELHRSVWCPSVVVVRQHCTGFLSILFDEMARQHNLELKRIQCCFGDEDEDDGDDRFVDRIDIVSSNRDEVIVDINPRLFNGELEDELQYQRILEGHSSERPYIGENREMANFHRPRMRVC
jgi:hypothetical protein